MMHSHLINTARAALVGAGLALAMAAQAGEPEVYFIEPTDGATVENPVTVKFGLKGMGVAPAGIEKDGTGHHHLLVDVESLPPGDQPIPSDEHHRHFGGGQTQTTLELEPGKHTLQLLMGDFAHRPGDNPVASEKITITVE